MADRAAQQRFLVPFFRERDSRVELQEVEPGRLQAIATRSGTGGANPGRFTDKDREELAMTLRLSALAHAELALHFGRKLAKRGTGGLLFVGATGADTGAPFKAHDGGAKAPRPSSVLA